MACILVLDDEPELRSILGLILTQAGYDVIEVANGRECVRWCQTRRIDVALVDLFMPEQDGCEIIRTLCTLMPPIKLIAMSGGGQRDGQDVMALATLAGAHKVLQKPVLRQELLAAVRAVLA